MAVPERIYLQIGENCEEIKADFGDGEVTWSVDQIYSTDIEYVNAATIARLEAERKQMIEDMADAIQMLWEGCDKEVENSLLPHCRHIIKSREEGH
jgi:protein subunit release factor A